MLKAIKKIIERILVSKLVYILFVEPTLKNGYIKIRNNYLYIIGQAPYLHSLLFWRIYERREVKLIYKYLIRNMPVVELGASLGLTTATICSIVENGVKSYAVEANPKLFEYLNKTKSRNNFTNLSIISAVIDYSGNKQTSFILDERNLASHKGTSANSILVDTISLKEVIDKNKISEYNLICDIEGAEVEMLLMENDTSVINNCKLLILELHETSYMGKEYRIDEIEYLVSKKFSMHCVDAIGAIRVFKR